MKRLNQIMMSTAMILALNGNMNAAEKPNTALIGKSDIKIEGQRMTPEALWAMGRIGDYDVSPDGKRIVYTVAYYSVPENKSNREIFIMNADGSENKQLTHSPYQENEVKWIKGGTKIAFLSNDDGTSQLYEMNPDGTNRTKLSSYDGDMEGYLISPDGKKVLFISQIKTIPSTADKYPDLPKASGIIVKDLMYKHWDEWVTTAPHPFLADFDGIHSATSWTLCKANLTNVR
jgi:dipeptidyl aminopeptidase/acylaminoacyl peptidase